MQVYSLWAMCCVRIRYLHDRTTLRDVSVYVIGAYPEGPVYTPFLIKVIYI